MDGCCFLNRKMDKALHGLFPLVNNNLTVGTLLQEGRETTLFKTLRSLSSISTLETNDCGAMLDTSTHPHIKCTIHMHATFPVLAIPGTLSQPVLPDDQSHFNDRSCTPVQDKLYTTNDIHHWSCLCRLCLSAHQTTLTQLII